MSRRVNIIDALETKLRTVFKISPPLSEDSKKSIINIVPIFALVSGVLQIWSASSLWSTADAKNPVNTGAIYTVKTISAVDKLVIHVGAVLLAIAGLLFLMAYPKLKSKRLKGWKLLFLGTVLGTFSWIVQILYNDRSLTMFVFQIALSTTLFYLLFQIHSKYSPGKK